MAETHQQIVQRLIARWPEHRIAPGTERVEALCELLGSPQRSYPVIQIAGTNGKGSTAIMIDALLRSLGLRTGRFTSPHLNEVTERICIDGEPISEERFDDVWADAEYPDRGLVKVAVYALRKKLGQPDPIRSEPGLGYRVVP